jgi:hypothetical protein
LPFLSSAGKPGKTAFHGGEDMTMTKTKNPAAVELGRLRWSKRAAGVGPNPAAVALGAMTSERKAVAVRANGRLCMTPAGRLREQILAAPASPVIRDLYARWLDCAGVSEQTRWGARLRRVVQRPALRD